MTTIRESGFVLKIATGQAIGVTNEADLNPANQSSGSALLGEVLTADGSGGASWSAESGLGDVTGPAGGVSDGDVCVFSGATGKVIKRPTGAVDFAGQQASNLDQSNLTPASMSSGAATLGQLLTAGGGGATSWQDPPASINLPGSSTDDALVRWDGVSGDTVADSGVTLSDAGAMVFPSAGSISKPSTGASSEAFGSGALAQAASSLCVGRSSFATTAGLNSAAIGNPATVSAENAVAVGNTVVASGARATSVGFGSFCGGPDGVALGYNASINGAATGAIAVGSGATVVSGHTNSIAIGASAATTAANRVTFASALEVEIGQGLGVWGATPPASQPLKINDPAGGATVDAESRSAINAILDVLEGAGLVASV